MAVLLMKRAGGYSLRVSFNTIVICSHGNIAKGVTHYIIQAKR
jgi:hypothetical protein